MKFLIALCATIACTFAVQPVSYAYSAYAPLGYAYNQLAYSAVPYAYSAPVAAPVTAYAAPVAAPVAVGVQSQYYSNIGGNINYGFSEPSQSQNVAQDPAGNKVGTFSYVNPNGKLVRTDFVADAAGYRVASNDLPAAPLVQPLPPADTPDVSAAKAQFFAEFAAAKSRSRRSLVQTPASTSPLAVAQPVAYAAAPVAYSAAPVAYAAAPAAYAAAPAAYAAAPLAYSAPLAYAYPYGYASPIVKPDGYLADTPEVSAAKANFFAQYAEAKNRGKRSVPAQYPLAYSAAYPYAYSYSPSPYAYSYQPYSYLSSFSSIGSPISQTFKK